MLGEISYHKTCVDNDVLQQAEDEECCEGFDTKIVDEKTCEEAIENAEEHREHC